MNSNSDTRGGYYFNKKCALKTVYFCVECFNSVFSLIYCEFIREETSFSSKINIFRALSANYVYVNHYFPDSMN